MARYVKISCLSGDRGFTIKDYSNGGALDGIIEYWTSQFDKVLPDKPDLILLPEECDTHPFFSGKRKLEFIKYRGDKIREHFAMVAKKHNTHIAYGAIRKDGDGNLKNSLQIIDRKGHVIGVYDKNHLVIGENEEYGIQYGRVAPVIKCDFGTIGCLICFDLNFEELRLKYERQRPELMLFSSMYHGGLRQNYYAYSLRSHFAASIWGLESRILSPLGEVTDRSTNYFNYVTGTVNLDSKVIHLDHNWDRLSRAREKYGSDFRMSDPGYLGAVLISSENEKPIDDYVKEFEFELIDDYFNRSLNHRKDSIKE